MTVLSLFDGMSCGQLALVRAGIDYGVYYASEIDKWAIKVTQHRFPQTVQIGDVREVTGKALPKIDLLIGGSPCKGFSRAGNGLNFGHPESKLFFEYVRILNEVKPKYFLLENVKMKKEWELEINKILKCRPLRFNSAWVSAQTRERLYWTNIPVNDIPIDRRIVLSDIIEGGHSELSKSYAIDINYFKGGKKTAKPKSQSQRRNMVIQVNESKESGGKQPYQQNRIYDVSGKSPALMAQLSSGSYMIEQRARGFNKGGTKAMSGKTPTLSANSWEHNNTLVGGSERRKLTVKECCRLQTVPDDYFEGIVSDTQAYKMLGNGWTVDMIAFILSFLSTGRPGGK